jgi:hypothetical protein
LRRRRVRPWQAARLRGGGGRNVRRFGTGPRCSVLVVIPYGGDADADDANGYDDRDLRAGGLTHLKWYG